MAKFYTKLQDLSKHLEDGGKLAKEEKRGRSRRKGTEKGFQRISCFPYERSQLKRSFEILLILNNIN